MSNRVASLFLAHRRELEAYLQRLLRDAEMAADLTQETFLRFTLQARNDGDVITHARSYLFRTAHNLAVDYSRQVAVRPEASFDLVELDQLIDGSPAPESIVGGERELQRLRALLMELPERTRRVFTLCRIEGMTYRDAARALGISDSSVQKHLAQALKYTVQKLRDDDV